MLLPPVEIVTIEDVLRLAHYVNTDMKVVVLTHMAQKAALVACKQQEQQRRNIETHIMTP